MKLSVRHNHLYVDRRKGAPHDPFVLWEDINRVEIKSSDCWEILRNFKRLAELKIYANDDAWLDFIVNLPIDVLIVCDCGQLSRLPNLQFVKHFHIDFTTHKHSIIDVPRFSRIVKLTLAKCKVKDWSFLSHVEDLTLINMSGADYRLICNHFGTPLKALRFANCSVFVMVVRWILDNSRGLRHLDFGEANILGEYKRSGWITLCPNQDVCVRNACLHGACRAVVLTCLLIGKFRKPQFRDVMGLIARFLWSTRGEIATWTRIY